MTTTDKTWDVEDYGTIGPDNAVWLHCEHIEARDQMTVGSTCRLTFKTGVDRDTVEVTRLT